jgi:hypothetical protein
MDISRAVVQRMGIAGTAPGEDGCRRYCSGKGWVPPQRRSDHRRTTRAALPLLATLVLATLEMGLASPLGLLGPKARLLDLIGLEECIHL